MAQQPVSTFAELKSAVEGADVTDILVTADIEFTSGIRIPVTKKQLTLDCGNHTITDRVSTAATDALYVPTGAGTMDVTVKNAVWSGRNYYGVVCVYDDSANADVTISLQNITYTGPQMIYNRYGTTVVQNCVVNIQKNGASAAPQEFCEANRLTLAGNVTVTSATTSNAVMWFPFAGAALRVEPSANVTVNAPDTYLIYSDTAAKPSLTFMEQSTTTINVKSGLFYSSGTGAHIASSCTVGQNAALSVTASSNNGTPLLKCVDKLTVLQGAKLSLVMPQSGSAALVYFAQAADVNIDQPDYLVLYSSAGKVFSFATGSASAPNKVTFVTKQLNYWTTSKTPFAQAGGLDDKPTTVLTKSNGADLTCTQTLTRTAVVETSTDLAEGDQGYPVTTTNFDLTKATVISAGEPQLTADKLTDLSVAVQGTTWAGAMVRFVVGDQTLNGTADEQGKFDIALPQALTVGETVQISANKDFVTAHATAPVYGSVSITKLPDIPFNAIGTPRNTAALKRIDPDWQLELTDTRTNGGNWALYVTLASPLQTTNSTVIPDAVVLSDSNSTTIISSQQTLVKQGVTDSPQVIAVTWQETEGILLDIANDITYTGGKYSATLHWSVTFD